MCSPWCSRLVHRLVSQQMVTVSGHADLGVPHDLFAFSTYFVFFSLFPFLAFLSFDQC